MIAWYWLAVCSRHGVRRLRKLDLLLEKELAHRVTVTSKIAMQHVAVTCKYLTTYECEERVTEATCNCDEEIPDKSLL